MSNMFSIFDPAVSHSRGLGLNWAAILRAVFLPSGFWVFNSKGAAGVTKVLTGVAAEVKLRTFKGVPNAAPLVLLSLFSFVLLNNFLGLLPYVFTPSRHPAFTCALSLSTWLGYFVYRRMANPSRFFSHLVPLGTPRVLIPFMVLIELVSSLMRPLTLSIRLAANIIAGHLLLVLASGPGASAGAAGLSVIMTGLVALVGLELGVSFIQRYVFMSLSSLYVGELKQDNL